MVFSKEKFIKFAQRHGYKGKLDSAGYPEGAVLSMNKEWRSGRWCFCLLNTGKCDVVSLQADGQFFYSFDPVLNFDVFGKWSDIYNNVVNGGVLVGKLYLGSRDFPVYNYKNIRYYIRQWCMHPYDEVLENAAIPISDAKEELPPFVPLKSDV